MANTAAIQAVQAIYEHVDNHVRELLPPPPGAEVDTINVIIGNGVDPIVAGIAAAIRVDFRCRITGCFFQEFDGTTGSIRLDIERSPGGAAPSWARISPVAQPGFTDTRYSADDDVTGWLTSIERGDYLRFVVTTASDIMRVHVGLRIRRLEP